MLLAAYLAFACYAQEQITIGAHAQTTPFPKASYFALYAHTARALMGVSPRLRVGGQATAAVAWVNNFLCYASPPDKFCISP
jgi:hypothetical protein